MHFSFIPLWVSNLEKFNMHQNPLWNFLKIRVRWATTTCFVTAAGCVRSYWGVCCIGTEPGPQSQGEFPEGDDPETSLMREVQRRRANGMRAGQSLGATHRRISLKTEKRALDLGELAARHPQDGGGGADPALKGLLYLQVRGFYSTATSSENLYWGGEEAMSVLWKCGLLNIQRLNQRNVVAPTLTLWARPMVLKEDKIINSKIMISWPKAEIHLYYLSLLGLPLTAVFGKDVLGFALHCSLLRGCCSSWGSHLQFGTPVTFVLLLGILSIIAMSG